MRFRCQRTLISSASNFASGLAATFLSLSPRTRISGWGLALDSRVRLSATSASAGSPGPHDRFRMQRALDHHPSQGGIERMFRVGPIEAVISVAPAQDELRSLQLRQFVLHRLQGEEAQAGQLSDIQFLSWVGKQELKNLCTDHWKQRVQKCPSHAGSYIDRLKRSSSKQNKQWTTWPFR